MVFDVHIVRYLMTRGYTFVESSQARLEDTSEFDIDDDLSKIWITRAGFPKDSQGARHLANMYKKAAQRRGAAQ